MPRSEVRRPARARSSIDAKVPDECAAFRCSCWVLSLVRRRVRARVRTPMRAKLGALVLAEAMHPRGAARGALAERSEAPEVRRAELVGEAAQPVAAVASRDPPAGVAELGEHR